MRLTDLNYQNVENVLLYNGFAYREKFHKQKLYSPDSGDYMRYISPNYGRKHGGYQIGANIGIKISGSDVEQFMESIGSEDRCMYFDLLSSNFGKLMYMPTFDDFYGRDLDIWISMICHEARILPADIHVMAQDFKENRLGEHELWGFMALTEKAPEITEWVIKRYG